MNIQIRNLTEFKAQLITAVGKTTSDKAMDAIALEGIAIIKERTGQGEDVNGEPFVGYSTTPLYIPLKHRPAPRGGIKTPQTRARVRAYNRAIGRVGLQSSTVKRAAKKLQAGKSMFFPGGYRQYRASISTTVNLKANGDMFRALMARREGKNRILYFGGAAIENAKSVGNNEGNKFTPRREFFGLGRIKSEQERIQKVWEAAIGKL